MFSRDEDTLSWKSAKREAQGVYNKVHDQARVEVEFSDKGICIRENGGEGEIDVGLLPSCDSLRSSSPK